MDVMLAPAAKLRRVSMLLAFIRSEGGEILYLAITTALGHQHPAPISARLGRCSQVLGEESERAAPGEIGRRLVVARRASVVVEGVLRARVGVDRVFFVVCLEGCFVGRDVFVSVVFVFGVIVGLCSLVVLNVVSCMSRV